ncbi:hypothetical protein F52700_7875 [Fusarium sp. NRRL 52700]|nr:hypothetical protein F52700_7875 [Fusarium sp. NRRL 52700]
MVVLTHDVDPQGDLIVVLKEPNSANLVPEVFIRKPGTVKGKSEWYSDEDALNHPKVEPVFTAVEGSESDKEPVEVHFRVSSQHMKLASPFFKTLLNGPWSEVTVAGSPYTPASRAESASLEPSAEIFDDTFEEVPPRTTACNSSSPPPTREVIAHGWSPEALLLVLKVIHGMNDEFPLVISVEFLAEVATIVDYYHCWTAVQLAGVVWRQTLYSLPLTYGKRCILWLFIAWAFGWKDTFSKLASFVIEHGEGLELVKSNELPVRTILEKLDAKRQECIAKIITRLNELTEELLDGRAGCDHRCSSMLLGSLLRERRDLPLLDPDLQSPYTGYSVYKYSLKISAFRAMDWGYMGWAESATAHRCTILTLMEPLLKTIDNDIKNFNMSETVTGSGQLMRHQNTILHPVGFLFFHNKPLLSCQASFFFLYFVPSPLKLTTLKNLFVMKTISYVIDPDGDVELLLTKPNSNQIIPKIHSDDYSSHTDLSDCCFDNPPATGRYTIFSELYTKSTTATGTQKVEEDHEPREVRMRISSKHLSFASSTFRDLLLTSSNKDASAQCSACSSSPARPFIRVHTIGWDAMALAIVLDVIHGRHAEIPRVINLGLLARIATVVDYYKCQEVIHIFFGYWQRNIIRQAGFPTTLCKRTLLWLYICMVFPGQDGIFASMARTVVTDFRGSAHITARMLPLTTTLRKLNEKRLDLIEQINDGLQNVRNTLLEETGCIQGDRLCSSLTLAPFDGYSVSTALKLVKECIEPMPLHGNPGTDVPRYINPYDGRAYPCSIRWKMTPVIANVEEELYRMRPADFKD